MGNDQDHGEITAEHGAAGILHIAAEAVEYLGHIGHDARAVLADDGHGKMGKVLFAAFVHINTPINGKVPYFAQGDSLLTKWPLLRLQSSSIPSRVSLFQTIPRLYFTLLQKNSLNPFILYFKSLKYNIKFHITQKRLKEVQIFFKHEETIALKSRHFPQNAKGLQIIDQGVGGTRRQVEQPGNGVGVKYRFLVKVQQ